MGAAVRRLLFGVLFSSTLALSEPTSISLSGSSLARPAVQRCLATIANSIIRVIGPQGPQNVNAGVGLIREMREVLLSQLPGASALTLESIDKALLIMAEAKDYPYFWQIAQIFNEHYAKGEDAHIFFCVPAANCSFESKGTIAYASGGVAFSKGPRVSFRNGQTPPKNLLPVDRTQVLLINPEWALRSGATTKGLFHVSTLLHEIQHVADSYKVDQWIHANLVLLERGFDADPLFLKYVGYEESATGSRLVLDRNFSVTYFEGKAHAWSVLDKTGGKSLKRDDLAELHREVVSGKGVDLLVLTSRYGVDGQYFATEGVRSDNLWPRILEFDSQMDRTIDRLRKLSEVP